MSWNYRVMRRYYASYEASDGIYEVYYDDTGTVKSWTDSPVPVVIDVNGYSDSTIADQVELMKMAVDLPVLNWDNGVEI